MYDDAPCVRLLLWAWKLSKDKRELMAATTTSCQALHLTLKASLMDLSRITHMVDLSEGWAEWPTKLILVV